MYNFILTIDRKIIAVIFRKFFEVWFIDYNSWRESIFKKNFFLPFAPGSYKVLILLGVSRVSSSWPLRL